MGQSDLSAGNSDDLPNREGPTPATLLTKNVNSHDSSIPVSAIAAIVIQSLITIYLIYFGVSVLLETREEYQVAPVIWPFLLTRLITALGVLIGMRHRKYIARKVSRALCTLGLIVGGVVIIYILTVGVTSLHEYVVLKVAAAHCLVWLTLVVSLGTKSAAKWFTE